jgi:hypothetical protein
LTVRKGARHQSIGAQSKKQTNKRKKQSLLTFATVERKVGSDKIAAIKFRLNKRAKNLVSLFKSAGLATLPLKATMSVRQEEMGSGPINPSTVVVESDLFK